MRGEAGEEGALDLAARDQSAVQAAERPGAQGRGVRQPRVAPADRHATHARSRHSLANRSRAADRSGSLASAQAQSQ